MPEVFCQVMPSANSIYATVEPVTTIHPGAELFNLIDMHGCPAYTCTISKKFLTAKVMPGQAVQVQSLEKRGKQCF
jgi:hypothetical protein